MGVVVVGQVGRDVALRTERLPDEGGTAPVLERLERLGGKGANQAVGLVQLRVPVSLVGVVGDDAQGAAMLAEATADGVDVDHVVRRGGTALLVTHVDARARRRLFEDVPDSALLTAADVERAAAAIDAADTVSVQLQQPVDAVLAAAHRGWRAGARVVADGVVDDGAVDELLATVHVLRADAKEAELLAGEPVGSVDAARAVAGDLLGRGPEVVALQIPGVGDLVAWPGGDRTYPLADVETVDPTGAGDAFVAALVAALRDGATPSAAGELATRAAAATVTRLGGRPELTRLTHRRP
ncbi:ribokinase [Mycolicibacterium sp. P1-18]|uniref:PfkB family carbohydrate kinase n=1 Tax=Mycolicibacterium sp. P1-18 TaxID=2024615 RepID=UPI0011F1403B|nr:PfkB family carbohydrate kinase [Mycolicibacterium sp. P1-18]KAA0101859.1 ribokinase [Mycolicibacterium sp. P1-18]